jgi:hypothetical protein
MMPDSFAISMQTCSRLSWIVLLLVLPACGPSNPLGRRAITGRVTLDGAALESGHIDFAPQKPDGVASGAMIVQGEYQMKMQQGLPPGKYIVRISSPEMAKGSAASAAPAGVPPPGIERVPRQYNAESTLTTEVTASGPTRFDFDLKTKISP